jgi:hypothetical protein
VKGEGGERKEDPSNEFLTELVPCLKRTEGRKE